MRMSILSSLCSFRKQAKSLLLIVVLLYPAHSLILTPSVNKLLDNRYPVDDWFEGLDVTGCLLWTCLHGGPHLSPSRFYKLTLLIMTDKRVITSEKIHAWDLICWPHRQLFETLHFVLWPREKRIFSAFTCRLCAFSSESCLSLSHTHAVAARDTTALRKR